MIRKTVCAVLAALLLCVSLTVSVAEPVSAESADPLQFVSGVCGNIAFQLPGMVERVRDGDMENAWTDSWQLMGCCWQDGAEFQLHMADIAPLIGYFRTNYPDDSEDTAKLQALMNYGLFLPNTYGIEVLDAQPHGSRSTGSLWLDLQFVYNDSPDSVYTGRFLLAGTQAVCLIMENCDHTQAVRDALRFVTDEEREALLLEKHQTAWYSLHGLEMTFPSKPLHDDRDGLELVGCFTEDWSFLQASFVPYGLVLNAGDDQVREALIGIAKEKMLVPYHTDELLDPVYSRPAEHTAQLDFGYVDHTNLGEYGQHMLGRLYVGEYGIWYVYASDDETGRAFLASVSLSEDGTAESVATAEALPAEPTEAVTVEAQADPALSPAAGLQEFRPALETLMSDSALDYKWKPGNFRWCDAVFSGGEWMRVVFSPDARGIGAALIRLDSSAEDAKIRGITMLRYDDDGEWKEDWLLFARLCALALRGDDAVTAEHLDPEDSTLVYDRVQIAPLGDVPPVAEDIPYPENADIEEIPDSGVTVSAFEDRMSRLTSFPLDLYSSDANGRIYTFGEEAGLLVFTDGAENDAQVTMVVVMGFYEEAAPVVMHATLVAFSAMTGMSAEEAVLSSYVLMETPMWDQLCDLWPLICKGAVCAHLQVDEEDGMWIPMGFVAARPAP